MDARKFSGRIFHIRLVQENTLLNSIFSHIHKCISKYNLKPFQTFLNCVKYLASDVATLGDESTTADSRKVKISITFISISIVFQHQLNVSNFSISLSLISVIIRLNRDILTVYLNNSVGQRKKSPKFRLNLSSRQLCYSNVPVHTQEHIFLMVNLNAKGYQKFVINYPASFLSF